MTTTDAPRVTDDGYGFNNPYCFTQEDTARILEELRKGTVHFDSGDDAVLAWIVEDWQRLRASSLGLEERAALRVAISYIDSETDRYTTQGLPKSAAQCSNWAAILRKLAERK
jgi:hypothetical protein